MASRPKEKERDPSLVEEGRRVAAAMAKRGLSRRHVADSFGITDKAVGFWLRGDVAVPIKYRARLKELLGLDDSDLETNLAAAAITRDVDALAEAAYSLALQVVTAPDSTQEARMNAAKVLEAYRDLRSGQK